jgi:uncharacterized protein
MKEITFTKQQVQNFLINRSFLVHKAKDISEVLNFYTCIQVDPINVIARSHELALYNRVQNFKLTDLHNALYGKRNLFEYWLQLYSIIPLSYFPFFKPRFNTKKGWQQEYYQQNKQVIGQSLEFIASHGPTSSKDLEHLPKVRNLFSWSGNTSRTGILNYLWDTGKIMVHSRKKNTKYYELTEKVIPADILNIKINKKTALEFLLKSNFKYLGILRKTFLTSGRMGYVKRLGLQELFDKLLKKGHIKKINIKDVKTSYYALTEDLDKIDTLSARQTHQGLNILSPLDPLIIDRRILQDIFNFKYTWEAYTPASKRTFGYYGMPLLYQGQFIGQIELRKDKAQEVNIRNLRLNTKVNQKNFRTVLQQELAALQQLIISSY